MIFMDRVMVTYHDPFIFLDELIRNREFFVWVNVCIDRENNDQIYDVWVHKVWDKTFDDFKRSVMKTKVDEHEIEEAILDSQSLLNNFIPI